ncbi:MAG TPA: type IV secretion system DotC family protein [Coxiellaceae bacterium]|nr:type IV secretion system DotC family protein [Coxiellaceae bacterium]
MKIRTLIVSSLLILVAACHHEPPNVITEMGYIDPSKMPHGEETINPIRLEALKVTATSLGAQGALAWRAWHINQALTKQAPYLDRVFDFNQLLIGNNVMPPILVKADHSLNLADNDTIRFADKTYEILKPARFVTTPPTWRTYLWMNYKKPDFPDNTLLPRDQVESTAWNNFLKEGWKHGLQQANGIFAANLSGLKRDYLGMVIYRDLLAQNMISAPYIAKANLGVTGDTQQLRINDQIMRITAHSALQPDSSQWEAVIPKSTATQEPNMLP